MRKLLLLATCILASTGAYAAASGYGSLRVVSFGAILVSLAAAWTACTLALKRREDASIRGSINAKAGPELVTEAEVALATRRALAREASERERERAPDLEDLSWDAPLAPAAATVEEVVAPVETDAETALRRRILDRYIGARFAGVASGAAELADSTRVIKSARLLFQDGQPERGLELLQVASDLFPADPATQLARLELLFLERDAIGYERATRRLASDHPQAAEWPEVRELGRKLGLAGELFRDQGIRSDAFPHYGPWPGLPNWIQAPWDLSGEVAMAELHARMVATVRAEAIALKPAPRRAA